VAGCLALHRLEVVTGRRVHSGRLAYVSCAVQPRYGGGVDVEGLAVDLRRGLSGRDPAGAAPRTAPHERHGGGGAAAHVAAGHPRGGAGGARCRLARLLYRIAHALEEAGADVRAARISTLGTAVVDAFYLEGTEWSDERRAEIEKAVLDAVSAPTPATAG
jgi:[protein-PII] uridylyltransferase